MIDRLLGSVLARAPKSVLLLGPRQTGKSTLVLDLRPDMVINLARESEFLTFAANASELEERIRAKTPGTVLIDEVQRLPSLLNTVQAMLDEAKRAKKPLKFFLTGSSARKLRRGQANLLPGRVLCYRLGPLASAEIGPDFDARKAMEIGTLPEPYLEPDRSTAEKLLASYSGTYLREEIQAEALSRNLEGFSRFLNVAAACSGQSLDFSKLSQRARLSRTGTVRYFEALDDTLLVYRLAPFPEAKDADMVKHPRYYFFDPGVLNGLLGAFTASLDRVGALFEHLVVSQLWATASAYDRDLALHTFRTRGGLEVDFIARFHHTLWAIEAKATARVTDRDAAPLIAAKAYLPKNARPVIVIPSGPPRRLACGVEVLALADLMSAMAAG
jgi:Predicted ATPase (AAA+ superfamily)